MRGYQTDTLGMSATFQIQKRVSEPNYKIVIMKLNGFKDNISSIRYWHILILTIPQVSSPREPFGEISNPLFTKKNWMLLFKNDIYIGSSQIPYFHASCQYKPQEISPHVNGIPMHSYIGGLINYFTMIEDVHNNKFYNNLMLSRDEKVLSVPRQAINHLQGQQPKDFH